MAVLFLIVYTENRLKIALFVGDACSITYLITAISSVFPRAETEFGHQSNSEKLISHCT